MTNPDNKITILLIIKSIKLKSDGTVNTLLRRYANDVYEIPNIVYRPFDQDKAYNLLDFIDTILYKTTKLPLLRYGKGFIPVSLCNFIVNAGQILLVYSCFVPEDVEVPSDLQWVKLSDVKNLKFDDNYFDLLMKEDNGVI